jgi:hypothetical protein
MIETYFPALSRESYEVTSPRARSYNCIAWAAGDQEHWWWPGPPEEGYWPDAAPRELSIPAFVAAFGLLGFQECMDASLEAGFEKVALYLKEGSPTHAARQLTDGRWTSKLGKLEDIMHESLDALRGEIYGEAKVFLRRRLADRRMP